MNAALRTTCALLLLIVVTAGCIRSHPRHESWNYLATIDGAERSVALDKSTSAIYIHDVGFDANFFSENQTDNGFVSDRTLSLVVPKMEILRPGAVWRRGGMEFSYHGQKVVPACDGGALVRTIDFSDGKDITTRYYVSEQRGLVCFDVSVKGQTASYRLDATSHTGIDVLRGVRFVD